LFLFFAPKKRKEFVSLRQRKERILAKEKKENKSTRLIKLFSPYCCI